MPEVSLVPKSGVYKNKCVNEEKATGMYQINFTAQRTTNNKLLASGMPLVSGMYFYTLTAGKFTDTKKIILIK